MGLLHRRHNWAMSLKVIPVFCCNCQPPSAGSLPSTAGGGKGGGGGGTPDESLWGGGYGGTGYGTVPYILYIYIYIPIYKVMYTYCTYCPTVPGLSILSPVFYLFFTGLLGQWWEQYCQKQRFSDFFPLDKLAKCDN